MKYRTVITYGEYFEEFLDAQPQKYSPRFFKY